MRRSRLAHRFPRGGGVSTTSACRYVDTLRGVGRRQRDRRLVGPVVAELTGERSVAHSSEALNMDFGDSITPGISRLARLAMTKLGGRMSSRV